MRKVFITDKKSVAVKTDKGVDMLHCPYDDESYCGSMCAAFLKKNMPIDDVLFAQEPAAYCQAGKFFIGVF